MAGLVSTALVGPRHGVLEFEPPSLEPQGGQLVGWRQDMAWMVREGAPWVGRRARDLGPWAVRMAWEETRPRRTPVA